MFQIPTSYYLSIGGILFFGVVIFIIKTFFHKSGFQYKLKGPYLLSAGEKTFFDVLQQSIAPDLYICPKVRVADLIEVNGTKNDKTYWSSFNKISQKHVDFVLCNRADFAPRLVIELDGGSHNLARRSQRDAFVNEVFHQVGILVLHVPVQSTYESNDISMKIQNVLSTPSTSPESL